MKKLTEGNRQLVASPKGGKAMLIFRGMYKKMFIDSYQPSSRYYEHAKGRTTIIRLENMDKPKPRINLNKIGTHFYLIGLHLSAIFEKFNEKLQDEWLDRPEEVQLQLANEWQKQIASTNERKLKRIKKACNEQKN